MNLTKEHMYTITTLIWLLGLSILAYFDAWWPGIMLLVIVSVCANMGYDGEFRAALITFFVLGVIYVIEFYHLSRILNLDDQTVMAAVLLIVAIFWGYHRLFMPLRKKSA